MNDQVFPFCDVELIDENEPIFSFRINDIPLDLGSHSHFDNVIIIDLDSMTYNLHDEEGNNGASNSNFFDSSDENLNNIFDVIPKSRYVIQPPYATQEPSSLSLCSLNIVTIPDKLYNFIDSLDNSADIDIYGFCETRLEPNIESLYSIPSYVAFHQSRNRNGGGVSLYIKQCMNPTVINDLCTTETDIECVAVECLIGTQKIFVAEVYRPHKNINVFLSKIEELLAYIRHNNFSRWYIMGDLNIDLLKSEDNEVIRLINLMSSNASFCTINKPTRLDDRRGTATLIDHIWTSDINNNSSNSIIWDDLTDHFPVCSMFRTKSSKISCKSIVRRKFSEANKVAFSNELTNVAWDEIYAMDDANIAYDSFINTISTAYNKYFPKAIVKVKPQPNQTNSPYMTSELRDMFREKRRLHRLAKRWPITYKQRYIDFRNRFNGQIKTARDDYYKSLLQNSSGDSKATWRVINNVLGRTKSNDQQLIEKSDDKLSHADFINKYFIETVHDMKSNSQDIPPDDFKQYMNPPAIQSIYFHPVKPEEVKKYITSIKTKACGVDDIAPDIVKLTVEAICKPLTHLINLSFKSGIFPTKLKVAKIIPIHKTGDKRKIENKRPISLLNIFAKVYEKAIYDRLYNYIEQFQLISNYQHGFRKNHSTETAIIQFIHNIYKAMEKRHHYIGICIDFSKAFDCLNHKILLSKLENIGVRGPGLALMTDYLSNRKQMTYYNDEYSTPAVLQYGTPQGSQLGPLLFAVYINDLVNCSQILSFALYADDSNAGASGPCLAPLIDTVNVELCHVNNWITVNHLSANNTKLLHLLFTYETNIPNYELKLGESIIPRENHAKLLGLIIDDRLKWSEHTTALSKKLSKLNGVLYLCRKKLSNESLRTIYYSLAYSHISYCIPIWGGTWAQHLKPVITAQKRLLRTITYSPYDQRSLPLFIQNRLLSFTFIYKYFASMVAFKFINSNYCPDIFHNLQIQRPLRDNANKLVVPFFRTTRGQKSFFFLIPNTWNALNSDLRSITSVYSFKYQLKLFLFNQQSESLRDLVN